MEIGRSQESRLFVIGEVIVDFGYASSRPRYGLIDRDPHTGKALATQGYRPSQVVREKEVYRPRNREKELETAQGARMLKAARSSVLGHILYFYMIQDSPWE